MTLTGKPDGAATLCPVPLTLCADEALNTFRHVAESNALPGVDGHRLLTERAALMNLVRQGDQSTGGHCRLLASSDGVIVVNLPRMADWELVPAWLQQPVDKDWQILATVIANQTSQSLIERAGILGLAVADATRTPIGRDSWFTQSRFAQPAKRRRNHPPVVIDLTSLWAGPLCAHLWQQTGAQVIKVESNQRPDGARFGHAGFFDTLNDNKEQVSLPLHHPEGIQTLRNMIAGADIVLESSRPRALQQMGIVAEELLAIHPGLTWVSITGYGRDDPEGTWVAFGDDAGVAAGLSAILKATTGQWLICGDAIADPLTGLHAALAGWQAWANGGGTLVSVSLQRVVRHCITATAPADGDFLARQKRWTAHLSNNGISPQAPKGRRTL